MKRETPIAAIVKGFLSGMGGALALHLAMQAAQPPPTEPQPQRESPREVLARKLATCLFEKELPDAERRAWAELFHWVYGGAWGALYGIVQASLRLPLLAHGVLFGTSVWVAGPRFLLPAMRLTPPPEGETAAQTFKAWGVHALYGLATAILFGLLGRRCWEKR